MLRKLCRVVYGSIGFVGLLIFLTTITGIPYVFSSGYSGGGSGGGGGGGDAVTASGLQQFASTTSTQFLGVISDETGTGLVVGNDTPTILTPTLTAPVLGDATATTINKVAITAPATGSTLTIADGKTLTASNTLTFTGTDASSVAFGTGGTITYGLGTTGTPQFAALGLGNAAGASGAIITSALANCLTVGPNGTTNPTFQMDCSVASAATGLKITPTASGSGVTLAATGGTNESLTLAPKGSGTISIGAVNGTVNLNAATASGVQLMTNSGVRMAVFQKSMSSTPSARTSGVTTVWAFTGGADTALTTATEAIDFLLDLSQTKQHASNGTIALQRHVVLSPPTDTCASATCTITEDAMLAVSGPPTGGTNSAITQSEGILVETRALTNVTNGFGLVVNAPTGAATKNYAAKFTGDVVMAGHMQAGAAIGAVSSCGASASVAGADTAFRVTVGTTVTTSTCTIAFGTAFPTAPICVANDETTILLVRAVASTTAVVLTTATAFQNDVIGVMCRGYE